MCIIRDIILVRIQNYCLQHTRKQSHLLRKWHERTVSVFVRTEFDLNIYWLLSIRVCLSHDLFNRDIICWFCVYKMYILKLNTEIQRQKVTCRKLFFVVHFCLEMNECIICTATAYMN